MKIALPAEAEEIATAILFEHRITGVWVESVGSKAFLRAYFLPEEKGKMEAIERALRQFILPGTLSISTSFLPEERWQTAWQKHSVPVQRIGKRLLIRAPWHLPISNRSGREIILIEPGMAFGTGTHATTRGCLIFLERLIGSGSGGTFLDVGTGSGILGIAAAKLGAASITAVENDPVALAVAKKNARINKVSSRITFRKTVPSHTPFRWVTANLTAPVLISLVDRLSRSIRPAGKLVLSGMLSSEAFPVVQFYREKFTLLKKMRRGEWVTLLLERRKG